MATRAAHICPTMQFGTGNYDKSETTGFFLSPIPGPSVEYDGPVYEVDTSQDGLAKLLVVATFGTPLLFLFLLSLGPGDKTPFAFLDPFFS